MRKIKFRVVYKNEIQHLTYSDDFVIDTDGKLISDYSYLENDDYCVQQYTGVNDIHGNEIYEGDTIKDSLWSVSDAKVIFMNGMSGFRYDDLTNPRFVPLCDLTEPEIVKTNGELT